jgi:hypothetical protein
MSTAGERESRAARRERKHPGDDRPAFDTGPHTGLHVLELLLGEGPFSSAGLGGQHRTPARQPENARKTGGPSEAASRRRKLLRMNLQPRCERAHPLS